MPKTTKAYWIHAITPLHVGAGRGIGHVDLPIVREKVTSWPYVPGSAVKGVVAAHNGATTEARKANAQLLEAFGTAGDSDAKAGLLAFTDARVVCLPVRSVHGTFAWTASPMSLQRLARDLGAAGIPLPKEVAPTLGPSEVAVPEGSALVEKGTVHLEDLDLKATPNAWAKSWAEAIAREVFPDAEWRQVFLKRFAVLSDDVFNFLSRTGTEVVARVRLSYEKKTVETGALWYEENLPAETLLAGLVWGDPGGRSEGEGAAIRALGDYCSGEKVLQLGGKSTTGRGRARVRFSEGGAR